MDDMMGHTILKFICPPPLLLLAEAPAASILPRKFLRPGWFAKYTGHLKSMYTIYINMV